LRGAVLLALAALRARRIALAGAHGHRLVLDEVAHLDLSARDARERRRAAVLDEPLGADDRRGAALALRAEAPLTVAPQPPLLLLLGGGGGGLSGAAEPLGQRQRGERLLALRLGELEQPVV